METKYIEIEERIFNHFLGGVVTGIILVILTYEIIHNNF